MGKFNTFRPLKQLPGVRQISDVTTYKKAPEALTGEGLCAAMSMRWLQVGVPPTTETELKYDKKLQNAYIQKMEETNFNTGKTMEFLADRCGLAVQGRLPMGRPVEAKQWWTDRFGVGGALASKKFPSVIAGAISAYANEQLNTEIIWANQEAEDTQDVLPCYIWVHLHCPSITLMGETLEPSHNSVEFQDGEGEEHTVLFNDEQLTIDGELSAVFGGAHATALDRGTGGGYVYFDPDAGVYAMAGLGAFIDTIYQCYKKFNAPSREVWAESGLEAADVELQLVRIYPVKPSTAS